ncbi:MAG: hypothetical protein AAF456_14245 [Planctomycetota bacterium]
MKHNPHLATRILTSIRTALTSNGIPLLAGSLMVVSLLCSPCQAQIFEIEGELNRVASWTIPDQSTIESEIGLWLADTGVSEQIRSDVFATLERSIATNESRLDAVCMAVVIAQPELSSLIEQEKQRTRNRPPDFADSINTDSLHPFVRNHLILLAGRWYARNDLFDEANEYLNGLSTEEIVDPASLLFYRAVSQHQLLHKEDCIESVSRLLENSDLLPRRFRVVGELIRADIQPLEDGSLDEISRMMADIGRRQSLYRSGTTVRNQEEAVIEKLDKLIEDIEAQRQQQQQTSSSQSSSPMQDSRNAGGQGDGEVTGRSLEDGGQWGDLPPEQRAAALAEMSRDLPPHYRTVIEEYFRQLAKERDDR